MENVLTGRISGPEFAVYVYTGSDSNYSTPLAMTRTAVHRNIEFEGIIRGCADNQWLITDALFEVASSPTEPSPRWRITSQILSAEGSPHKLSYQLEDRHLKLELSAPSASALAEQIRTRFYNKCLDQ